MLSWTMVRRGFGSLSAMALLVGLIAALPAPAGAASRPGAALLAWRVRQTPNQTVPNGVLLADSCARARACIAVGDRAGGTGPFVAFAETWNGTSWRLLATPTPVGASFAQLVSVSCSAANACTAVGSYAPSFGRDIPLAERWNGSRWKIQAAPRPAGAAPARLLSVSCSAASACTAVGTYVLLGPRDIPFAEAWNGARWKILPVPSPAAANSADLTGISCRQANVCTAVGAYTNRSFTSLTLAERWNGTRWRIQASPNRAGAAGSGLSEVSCSSARACTAAGSSSISGSERTLAEAWNGTRWRIQATPNPAGATSSGLSAVSCSSAGACTAVGADFAERWNGTRWTLQVTPNPGHAVLGGVSCPSRSTCIAVGRHQDGLSILTLAEAWNGTSWRIQDTPNPAGTFGSVLRDVSCTSDSACTAVGFYNRSPFGPPTPVAEAWNGTRWSIQAVPSPPGALASELSAVSCTSASACTAVGGYNAGFDVTLAFAERWDGSRWTVQAMPSPSTTFAEPVGVSCTSATACTAVGGYDNSANTTLAFAEAWNGTSWSIQLVPSPAGALDSFLRSVSCTSANACTAVGDQGTLTSSGLPLAERWNGTSWSIQAIPSLSVNTTQLFGVSCSSADACTAIGYHRDNNGIALPLAEAWDGTSWSIQATPNPSGTHGMFLNGVSCSAPNACIAVGSTGDERLPIVAERWNGTSWGVQAMALPVGATSADVHAVSCVRPDACTAVGEYSRGSGTSLTLAETTF